ncbi:hypothetical protein ACIB24_22475 [Spongisporangium articulatum]|uniref:ESX secretion-associated protein EspG n=1 Tax=Spongisporangium articulatum TaxID=3362603 RepID=A0ABW8ATZ5_9ACTN
MTGPQVVFTSREVAEPRRLALSALAWRRLAEFAPRPLPGELQPPPLLAADPESMPGSSSESARIAAALEGATPGDVRNPDEELRASGVLVGPEAEPEVHPSVQADLAVLAAPQVLLRVDAQVPAGRRLAHVALAGELVVCLVRTDDAGGVELSLAPAVRLGSEIARLVPVLESATEASGEQVVPLEALDEPGSLPYAVVGRLLVDVLAAVPGPGGAEGLRGRVVWLATDAGWVGLRPRPDGTPRQPVALVPAKAADLPGWLAPLMTTALDLGAGEGGPA